MHLILFNYSVFSSIVFIFFLCFILYKIYILLFIDTKNYLRCNLHLNLYETEVDSVIIDVKFLSESETTAFSLEYLSLVSFSFICVVL